MPLPLEIAEAMTAPDTAALQKQLLTQLVSKIPEGRAMHFERAVFLDRDGVLTRERPDYVKTPEELEVLPGIYEPLRKIREKGFRIILVTNQSVIGRGLTTHEGLTRIHEKFRQDLLKHGCSLDAIYYCPHLPGENCDCRKPQPGMITRAARELGIDLSKSWLIGDKDIDIEAAQRAGCRGVRVETNGQGLATAVREILRETSTVEGGS